MMQKQNERISRRSFLQRTGVVGGTSLLATATGMRPAAAQGTASNPPAQTPDETIDIAIVGAGISGVYCAWRLLQDDPSRRILVFEAADRVGGRLLSLRPPDIPNMVAELGGMRILPAVQPLISNLIDALNGELASDAQIELYDFPVDEQQNIAYLRGTHLRLSDFTEAPGEVPFNLSYLEENFWNIGVKSWEVLEQIPQPLAGRWLFICDEAYSNWQGWVDGALQTADIVLDKFGIAPL